MHEDALQRLEQQVAAAERRLQQASQQQHDHMQQSHPFIPNGMHARAFTPRFSSNGGAHTLGFETAPHTHSSGYGSMLGGLPTVRVPGSHAMNAAQAQLGLGGGNGQALAVAASLSAEVEALQLAVLQAGSKQRLAEQRALGAEQMVQVRGDLSRHALDFAEKGEAAGPRTTLPDTAPSDSLLQRSAPKRWHWFRLQPAHGSVSYLLLCRSFNCSWAWPESNLPGVHLLLHTMAPQLQPHRLPIVASSLVMHAKAVAAIMLG